MNEKTTTEIFISYRRDGGVDYARMIFLELKGRGYRTFFDYNSLRDGKFNEGILRAIDECRYFILVLSNGALDRCADEGDWVRHEIERALAKGKSIVPVCPSGSMRGFPDALPPSLEPLRMLQISMLQMDDLFEKSFDKIVEDRFAEDFRAGRTPVAKADVVTVRSFRRIGVGVIAAIVAAAALVGLAVMRAGSADRRRLEEDRRRSDAAIEKAESERRASELAKAKAEEARIRAEAAAEAAKEAGGAPRESEALKSLSARETELSAQLATARSRRESLEKEFTGLDNAWRTAWSEEAQDAAWSRRSAAEKSLKSAEKEVQDLSRELEKVRETIARTRAVDEVYRGADRGAEAAEETARARDELERIVARVVARRLKAESLKDRIPADGLLKAKQLEEIANAEHGSLADALAKNKATDDAYGELLDRVVQSEIARVEATVRTEPEWTKWQTAEKLLAEVVAIDPDNERARKAYADAVGHVHPSMTVTAELDGRPVPDVRFFADGKPVPTPYHHVFENGNGAVNNLRDLDAVYVKDGTVYSARRYGSGHNWVGETNIVLRLRETPAAGTAIRLKLGRYPQWYLNRSGRERNPKKEAFIDLVWCPPGSDVVEYADPDTKETKSVVRSVGVGFWIARCELTGLQRNAILSDGGGFAVGRPERLPDDDRPAHVGFSSFVRNTVRPVFGDQASFDIPDVAEWFHAAHFGGFKVGEDEFADYAWCLENAGTNESFAVGRKKANRLGLYDVYGNEPEWVTGCPHHWLGLRELLPGRDDDLVSKMGGGCLDDFESSTDLLDGEPIHWNSGGDNGRAGIRLVARTSFEHETSLIEWVRAADLLDSGDPAGREEGLALLARYAKESPDAVLRQEAAKEFVARGGDPAAAGIAPTPAIRRCLVDRCTDEAELARYVAEDEDPDVKELAYRKIDNPSLEVSARYLASVEDERDAGDMMYRLFVTPSASGRGVPKDGVDESCFRHLALHAVNPGVRAKSLCGVKDLAVLKSVALNDPDTYPACVAVEWIRDRVLLMEIMRETKRKPVKEAAKARLQDLSR